MKKLLLIITWTTLISLNNHAQAPLNNGCLGAISLTVYATSCGGATTGTTSGATFSAPPITCNGNTSLFADDVWYKFVATATSHNITVVGNNLVYGSIGFNAVVDLRSGPCIGPTIDCADATGIAGTEVINATGLTIGSTYFVRVYDYSGNVLPSYTFTICITTPIASGISEHSILDFQIFPNPTNSNSDLMVTSEEKIVEIKIYNALGILMYYEKNVNEQNKLIPLNETKFSKGIYFAEVITNSSNRNIKRLLIQ